MKRIICCAFILSVALVACQKTSKEEMVIGDWIPYGHKFENESLTSKTMRDMIAGYESDMKNSQYMLSFGPDKRFQRIISGRNPDTRGRILYKLVDAQGRPDPNGNLIDFELYEPDGTLYTGPNKPGPFEIMEITEEELLLRDLRLRYKMKRQGVPVTDEIREMIQQEENAILKLRKQ